MFSATTKKHRFQRANLQIFIVKSQLPSSVSLGEVKANIARTRSIWMIEYAESSVIERLTCSYGTILFEDVRPISWDIGFWMIFTSLRIAAFYHAASCS